VSDPDRTTGSGEQYGEGKILPDLLQKKLIFGANLCWGGRGRNPRGRCGMPLGNNSKGTLNKIFKSGYMGEKQKRQDKHD